MINRLPFQPVYINKRLAAFLLLLSFCIYDINAQSVLLQGTVKSAQGTAIRGASVTFFDTEGNELEDCSTNSSGKFTSAQKYAVGKKVIIEVKAEGSETFKKDYVLKTGNFNTISLKALVKIKGVVKSDEGLYLKDVVISVYEDENRDPILANTLTDAAGAYATDRRFVAGQSVQVVASKTGFGETFKTVLVAPDGSVDLVLGRRIVMAGFVLDSVLKLPVVGAEVSFFNREGVKIDAVQTNQSGYYDFDAPFTPGEVIRVRVEKRPEYAPVEKLLPLVKHEINTPRLDFDLPKWADRGIKVGIRVYNRGMKPLKGVTLTFFDRENNTVITPENGEVILNVHKKPGEEIMIRAMKKGYKELPVNHNLGNKLEYLDFKMERNRSKCACWLWGGLGATALSGTGFLLYNNAYQKHQDTRNLDRESDFNRAKIWLPVGTIAGGAAVGSFIMFAVCKAKEAKQLKEEAEIKRKKSKRKTSFVPLQPTLNDAGWQIGIAYQF